MKLEWADANYRSLGGGNAIVSAEIRWQRAVVNQEVNVYRISYAFPRS